MMMHWIGAIILLAAAAFIIFAFRQGMKVKLESRADNFIAWWLGK
jgi:hypothetical protein